MEAALNRDWYVVCRFTSTRNVEGEDVLWPASVAHAKQMGTNETACRQNSSTWVKLFNMGFPADRSENCPECLDVVRARPQADVAR